MNILITGGASGLGGSITRKFCARGVDKAFFTYSKSKAQALELAGTFANCEPIECDFASEASLVSLIASIPDMNLDVIVNNALPSMQTRHFHQADPNAFLSSFALNVVPVIRVTQQVLKCFRRKKSGKIITILSSYAINKPPVGLSEYVANKAYLKSLSLSWAVENAKFNVSSNCISPSLMLTALSANMDARQLEDMALSSPGGRFVTTDEVADAVMFLASASQHINGVNLAINGGLDVI